MNKLLDLRFVIGLFFLITGLLLLIYYFLTTNASHGNINALCGSIFIVFGLGMILLSYKNDKEE